MHIIAVLLPVSMGIAGIFLWLFVRAANDGQFDDLEDARWRILDDDD